MLQCRRLKHEVVEETILIENGNDQEEPTLQPFNMILKDSAYLKFDAIVALVQNLKPAAASNFLQYYSVTFEAYMKEDANE